MDPVKHNKYKKQILRLSHDPELMNEVLLILSSERLIYTGPGLKCRV